VDATQARRLGYQSAGESPNCSVSPSERSAITRRKGSSPQSGPIRGRVYYSDFTVQRLEVCVRLAAVGFLSRP